MSIVDELPANLPKRLWDRVKPQVHLNKFECCNLYHLTAEDSDAVVIWAKRNYQRQTVILLGELARKIIGIPIDLIHPLEKDGVVWRQLPHPDDPWYDDPHHRAITRMLLEDLANG